MRLCFGNYDLDMCFISSEILKLFKLDLVCGVWEGGMIVEVLCFGIGERFYLFWVIFRCFIVIERLN